LLEFAAKDIREEIGKVIACPTLGGEA